MRVTVELPSADALLDFARYFVVPAVLLVVGACYLWCNRVKAVAMKRTRRRRIPRPFDGCGGGDTGMPERAIQGGFVPADAAWCAENGMYTLDEYIDSLELDGPMRRDAVGLALLRLVGGELMAQKASVLMPLLPSRLRDGSDSVGSKLSGLKHSLVDSMPPLHMLTIMAVAAEALPRDRREISIDGTHVDSEAAKSPEGAASDDGGDAEPPENKSARWRLVRGETKGCTPTMVPMLDEVVRMAGAAGGVAADLDDAAGAAKGPKDAAPPALPLRRRRSSRSASVNSGGVFDMSIDVDRVLDLMDLGLHPDERKADVSGLKPAMPAVLPDLCLGTGDLRPQLTPREAARCRVVAAVFNRLTANGLRLTGQLGGEQLFQACARPGMPAVTTASALFQQLLEAANDETGGETRWSVSIKSFPTVFSMHLCVRERVDCSSGDDDDEDEDGAAAARGRKYRFVPLPFAIAASTGLVDPETQENVPSLSVHTALEVRMVNCGDGPEFSMQIYQGTEGFMGWQADAPLEVPWLRGSYHHNCDPTASPDGDPGGGGMFEPGPSLSLPKALASIDAACALALASVTCADRHGLPMGGYGVIGTCATTAAVIERAVEGTTSVPNISGLGSVQQQVCHVAVELEEKLAASGDPSGTTWASAMRKVRKALVALPDDVQATPSDVQDLARRHREVAEPLLRCDIPFGRQLRPSIASLKRVEEFWGSLHE